MTTMFIQLRRVVYLLVLLHFCTCVGFADDDDKKKNGEKHAEKMVDWLNKVDVQYPGAKTCQRVGDSNNEKYAEIATKVWKVADDLKQSADKARKLVKELNESDEGRHGDIARQLNEHVDVVTTRVEESKEVIAAAREAREEARVLVGCTVFLGNLQDLRSENKKEALKYWTRELEEKNKELKLLEWGDLINRTRAKEAEVDMLVQNLTFSISRSRGISNEVAQSLAKAVAAAEEAVDRFEKVKENVNVSNTRGDYGPKVEKLKNEMNTTMGVKEKKMIPDKDPSVNLVNGGDITTKEAKWKDTVELNVGASPVTGALVREHPKKGKDSTIAKELNRVLEEEKENLKNKKIEEKKAFEEMKRAEIRRKEEERRAEAERKRRAEEEKARLEREKQEKKAREEKARQERAEEERKKREKLAEEEKERKAKEDAERAKNAKKKKDNSVRLALMHSPLLLLLLCFLGCTVVC
ncbi:uncharacterized protein TM35_000651280 [Trypanosoma theileri]|uniref:Uncharacterized protein n=1 Tax=Trypanosoma theileri TaxID=67003 RepID=A0A1X0NFS9_9TRYP|nr:uncharacterized protein TM35_000651280 [Trypanosoma theileri]ORC83566.1 hypothetical protein TM35_000651280 [Trypanosoma theileri]